MNITLPFNPLLLSRIGTVILRLLSLYAACCGSEGKLLNRQAFSLAFISTINIDFLLSVRNSYTDVLFILPLALLLPNLVLSRDSIIVPVLVFGGLVVGQSFLSPFEYGYGPRLRPMLFMGGMTWLMLDLIFKAKYLKREEQVAETGIGKT